MLHSRSRKIHHEKRWRLCIPRSGFGAMDSSPFGVFPLWVVFFLAETATTWHVCSLKTLQFSDRPLNSPNSHGKILNLWFSRVSTVAELGTLLLLFSFWGSSLWRFEICLKMGYILLMGYHGNEWVREGYDFMGYRDIIKQQYDN